MSTKASILKGFVIAIDGPVAAGKGTIAPHLAKKLKGFYLYTGAMYRCVALYCIENNINVLDKAMVLKALSKIDIELVDQDVFLNGHDVTKRIVEEDVAKGSSKVAVIQKVREEMVRRQQEIARKAIKTGKIVIAEGRDTATRVFPDAAFKVFLTARETVRAQRRLDQILAQGKTASFEEVLAEVKKRDERDSGRKIDPLVSDPTLFGYFVLDNSEMSEEETVNRIIVELRRRNLYDSH